MGSIVYDDDIEAHQMPGHKLETGGITIPPRGSPDMKVAHNLRDIDEDDDRGGYLGACQAITLSILGILSFLFGLASPSLMGFTDLIVGHAILRAAHRFGGGIDHPLHGSMRIGALGGTIAGLTVGCVGYQMYCGGGGRRESAQSAWRAITAVPGSAIFGAVSGAIGSAVLKKHGFDGQILTPRYAAAAGAVGGTIQAPVFIVIYFLVVGMYRAAPIRCGAIRVVVKQ